MEAIKIRNFSTRTKTHNFIFFQTWYNYSDIFDSWRYFVETADTMRSNPTFLHDLVDITRQALQVYGDINYNMLIPFFKAKDSESFTYVPIKNSIPII